MIKISNLANAILPDSKKNAYKIIMKKTILYLLVAIAVAGCKRQPTEFEFTIRGTVIGQESGEFYIFSSRRIGDEVAIPFENHSFSYSGTSASMFGTMIFLDDEMQDVISIIIEPGEIVLELDFNNFRENSRVVAGPYNMAMQEAEKELMNIFSEMDFECEESKAVLMDWFIEKAESFSPIMILSSWESMGEFMPLERLGDFVKGVHDKNLRKSRDFIKLYSTWLARKNRVNALGEKAAGFQLPDVNGRMRSFHSFSKKGLTYVEKSGSWCGTTTRDSRNLIPLYEKYRDQGFEIITIVPESNIERWAQWLDQEQFPWLNLVETDDYMASQKISLASLMFENGNYLVDEKGRVIANELSADVLKELLMERFEPEAYNEYMLSKWEMPGNAIILDRDQPVQSFEQLLTHLQGSPFMIDCWASWCSPCIDEFQYNAPLKAYLASKGMEMVYISFDREEAAWLQAIREHKLEGYHLRINDSLRGELIDIGFSGGIPFYFVMDKNGKVLVKDGFRPSQGEKLFQQIEAILK